MVEKLPIDNFYDSGMGININPFYMGGGFIRTIKYRGTFTTLYFFPQRETLTPLERAEFAVSEQSTLDVVNDMIINVYSHLENGNYESARKQLSYLTSLDISRVLDGNKAAQERVEGIILDSNKKLSETK